MSTRVIVPPRAAEGPTAPASSYDLGQKVRAAVTVGVFVTIGAWVVGGVLGLMWWDGFLWLFGVGGPVVGVLVMCYFGMAWAIAAASRPWRVDDKVRNRAWWLEDQERAAAEAAAKAAREDIRSGDLDHDQDPSTLTNVQRLHLVAIDVLARHHEGKATTRAVMEAEGRCTQAEWNAVNKLLLAVGLKRGYKLREDLDFQDAWSVWRSGVRLDGDRAWVKVNEGQERLVDLGG